MQNIPTEMHLVFKPLEKLHFNTTVRGRRNFMTKIMFFTEKDEQLQTFSTRQGINDNAVTSKIFLRVNFEKYTRGHTLSTTAT